MSSVSYFVGASAVHRSVWYMEKISGSVIAVSGRALDIQILRDRFSFMRVSVIIMDLVWSN